jgi:uncharacterized protein YndB with AHSA1/START domain
MTVSPIDEESRPMTDSVQRELVLSAAAADVWRAVTDPDRLADWLADEVALELRPGGEARFRIGAEIRTGWVEEVSPPSAGAPSDQRHRAGRLAFWWAVDGEPASRVELQLIPVSADATRLRVVETRPLEILDLVGIALPSHGGSRYGPALVAAT